MTRTIITADGTRLRDDTRTRRIIRRAIFATLTTIGLIFLSAAVIGITHPATHTPIVRTANDTDSFNDGWNTALDDIQGIGNSPQGRAKILNCLSAGGNADAFHTCIDR